MNAEELTSRVIRTFSHRPTSGQLRAIEEFAAFMTGRDLRPAMVLCGSAGTGKTSLAAAMVDTLLKLRQQVVLLAPTGRAAKVLSLKSGMPAYTIHRWIYRQKRFTGSMTGFSLNFNKLRDALFVVDEASMIANGSPRSGASFGSGCLLDDLVQFVYSGSNCRMLLIGDKAQLPPVGEDESPALMADRLATAYFLDVYSAETDEVLRQAVDSGILFNASMIRNMIFNDELTQLPRLRLSGFADIYVVPGSELIEQLAGSYSQVGTDETIVVTRSNKRANIYNRGIRNSVFGCEEELSPGDMLMAVRNNYYWIDPEEASEAADETEASARTMTFVANGDRAKVRRVRNIRELYGFRFADLTLEFPDYDYYELTATVVLDSLLADAPSLTAEQGEKLFQAVLADYAHISPKSERFKRVRNDAHFNALQVKFAYAVTCHKAQGGQWAHVYLDQGYMTSDMLTPDYIHWIYTAFTRATEKLFLVNWPSAQIEASM